MKKFSSRVGHKILMVILSLTMWVSTCAFAVTTPIMLRVNGMYCNLCMGASVKQLRAISGVGSVKLWLKNGIIVVVPSGDVNVSAVKNVIQKSSYPLVGAWSCPTITTDFAKCKSV